MNSLGVRPLGTSDLRITPVGIGTAPIGSTPHWRIYWGPQNEADALRAIDAAIDRGVNWIDTAPFYGWGRAEQLVGRALHGKRDKVYIFTKCGTLADGHGGWITSLAPTNIRHEVEASLRNLQTEYIDLYQFHDADPATPIEESWAAVQQLIGEGKVRYAGLSNHTVDLMERAHAIAPITSNQHQYNLLSRDVERDVLPFSLQHTIGVLAWAPLASGFLLDNFDPAALDPHDFRRRHPYLHADTYGKLTHLRTALQAIAHDHDRTLRELAVAWVLQHPAVTGAIIGVRNAQEAHAMLDGADWQLASEDTTAIEQALTLWSSG